METTSKTIVMEEITRLYEKWSNDPERWDNAAEVYEQIPITLSELTHEASFENAVRWAMHDLFRNYHDNKRG